MPQYYCRAAELEIFAMIVLLNIWKYQYQIAIEVNNFERKYHTPSTEIKSC